MVYMPLLFLCVITWLHVQCLCLCARPQGPLLSEAMGKAGRWLPEIFRQRQGNSANERFLHQIFILLVLRCFSSVKLWWLISVLASVLKGNHLDQINNECDKCGRAEVWGHHTQSHFYLQGWKWRLVWLLICVILKNSAWCIITSMFVCMPLSPLRPLPLTACATSWEKWMGDSAAGLHKGAPPTQYI